MLAAPEMDGERRRPRLAPGRRTVDLRLTPAEGFLLSRIDGATPWAVLRQIGGLPPEEAERCLRRWLAAGILVLDGPGPPQPPAAPAPEPAAPAAGPEEAELRALVDASLALEPEQQLRILRFEASLDRPYHEVLGVARDADVRVIKRAYFRLSREFHPDRYYRRQIGHFRKRLERIFEKLVEACELLSDPAARAEVERFLAASPNSPAAVAAGSPDPASAAPEADAAPPPPAAAPPAPDPARVAAPAREARRRQVLERLRRQVRVPEEILQARRLKASQLHQSAQVALRRGNVAEAAAGIRLAIAFDPWCDDYKESFAQAQARVHQLRAAELLEQANASFGSSARAEALRLYEEALHYRPCDPEVLQRAAGLALDLGELEKAREYAESACEIAPQEASHQVARARVLRRLGLRREARAAVDEALRLDPSHAGARAELADQRRPRTSG
jgi:curved DNA-binding protein CbpA